MGKCLVQPLQRRWTIMKRGPPDNQDALIPARKRAATPDTLILPDNLWAQLSHFPIYPLVRTFRGTSDPFPGQTEKGTKKGTPKLSLHGVPFTTSCQM